MRCNDDVLGRRSASGFPIDKWQRRFNTKHSPTKIAKKGSSVCTIPIDFAERESCLAACSSVCGPVGDLVEWKSLFEMLSESTAEQQGKWLLLHVVAVCVPRCECFGSLRDGCGWEGF